MLTKICGGKFKSPLKNNTPATYDFGSDSKRYWGHDYYIDKASVDCQSVEIGGWQRGLEIGDYLIFQMKDNSTTRYKITTLGYFDNPKDHFIAECKFSPRKNPKEKDNE